MTYYAFPAQCGGKALELVPRDAFNCLDHIGKKTSILDSLREISNGATAPSSTSQLCVEIEKVMESGSNLLQ
jgi:hypothetical protein